MLSLPLALINFALAIAALVAAWRLDLGNQISRWMFRGSLAVSALLFLAIGIRFGYGVGYVQYVHGGLALFLGPLLFLGFLAMVYDRPRIDGFIITHLLLIPSFALNAANLFDIWPFWDVILVGIYLIHTLGILWIWRKGPDALVNARLGQVDILRNWMLGCAGVLILASVMDGAIAMAFALGRVGLAENMIAAGAVLVCAGLILGLWAVLRKPVSQMSNPTVQFGEADKIETLVAQHLRDTMIFTDPNLTLDRLAKRVHLPARKISAAVNQSRGVNVSQYINEFRIAHAANLLVTTGDSVTKIADASGFLTRSNFYREFQRIHGMTPAAYRSGGVHSD